MFYTKVQECLWDLVKEFDNLCHEAGIPYTLARSTAACAKKYGEFTTGCYQFEVHMIAPDIIKFRDLVKKKKLKDRDFEDLRVNPNLPISVVRYVNTRSMVIDTALPMVFKMPGIAISIVPLYTQNIIKNREALERGLAWENMSPDIRAEASENPSEVREQCIRKTKRIQKIFGKQQVANYVYSNISREKNKQAGDKLYMRSQDSHKAELHASSFFNPDTIEFEDMKFSIPSRFGAYESKFYGAKWREKSIVWLPGSNKEDILKDVEMGYEDNMNCWKQNGYSIKELNKEGMEARKYYNEEIKELEAEVRRKYVLAKLSVTRIDTYLEYKDKMDELKEVAESGDMDKLGELMEPYLGRTYRLFNKQDVGLYVTDELWKYACMVWEYRKHTNYRDEVYAAIPKPHLEKDLVEFLKERGVN